MNPDAGLGAVNREIERLEKMYENHPDMYVSVMWRIGNKLFFNASHSATGKRIYKWSELIEELSEKIITKKTKSNYGKGDQMQTIAYYMNFDPDDASSEILTNRKIRVSKLLELWQSVFNSIEHDWEHNVPKKFLMEYTPSTSFKGIFISGQSSEGIEDPIVKKEYTEYLAKREALSEKATVQKQAKNVVRTNKDIVKKYIVDSYSLRPFAASELETLLKDSKLDEVFAKEILDAVRKAEKEAPPPSAYRNWHSKDGLFKAKAKFISSDSKSVTMEKEDGKQTTMVIEDLRSVDQRFIKEQIIQIGNKKD
ncbi:MAG: hypothetical protein LBJ00_01100 [Planctomycetaceae bacterium]|nr:hypothetical protein [Planctomycetaceae bacterium]